MNQRDKNWPIYSVALAASLSALSPGQVYAKPLESQQDGVASFDTRDEQVLVGKGAPGVPASADQQGKWQVQRDLLLRDGNGEASWWLAAQTEKLQDGFVRGRIRAHHAQTTSLIVRANVQRKANGKGELAILTGYGVTWHDGRLAWRRFDGGAQKVLSQGVALGHKGVHELEIQVFLLGPHLLAQVFDAETMQPLATLTASDATYAEGTVGLRVAGKHDAALSWLSFRRAGSKLTPRAGALGPLRYLQVPERSLADLQAISGWKLVDRSGGLATLQATALAKEAISHRFEVGEVFLDEPRKFADADFRAASAEPVVEQGGVIRRDRSYKDDAMVAAMLGAYAKKYSAIATLHEVGRTRQGRPLQALRIHAGSKSAADVPQVLINGAHHGVELSAVEFALDSCAGLLEGYGRDPAVTRWVEDLTVWCMPLVNPDGNHAYWHVSRHGGRKNGRDTDENGRVDPTDGVDLNRNYPFRWHTLGEVASHSDPRRSWYRGPRAASEPETQALMRLADAERFVASISYHTQANAILVPYTIPEARDPEPNEAWDVAKAMSARAGPQVNRRPLDVKRRLYPVDGVDQDWHRAAHGTTALLVEGTLTNPGRAKGIAMVAATRGTWQGLLERVLAGPGIRGRVIDSQGRPVVAQVQIKEIALNDGERWTSRCRDGRFERMVGKPGSYTVQAVGAGGQVLASQTVQLAQAQDPGSIAEVELRVASPAVSTASCSRPDLCAIDSLCRAAQGQCVQAGPASFCHIDGRCVPRGQSGQSGVCDPDREPWGWSPT
jgi:hypothetical protein